MFCGKEIAWKWEGMRRENQKVDGMDILSKLTFLSKNAYNKVKHVKEKGILNKGVNILYSKST